MRTNGTIEFTKDSSSSLELGWGHGTARINVGNMDALVGVTLTKHELGRLIALAQAVYDALDADGLFDCGEGQQWSL